MYELNLNKVDEWVKSITDNGDERKQKVIGRVIFTKSLFSSGMTSEKTIHVQTEQGNSIVTVAVLT